MPAVEKPLPVRLRRMPDRAVLVLLQPGTPEFLAVTDVTLHYDGDREFGVLSICAPRRTTGPKLRAEAEGLISNGWRRCGDWLPVETCAPWRGWIAPIEPIEEV